MSAARVLLALALLPLSLPASSADGDLDAGFGTGGVAATAFATPTGTGLSGVSTASAVALALQADGKVVAVARVQDTGSAYRRFVGVTRLGADGTPDTAFGTGGVRVVGDAGASLEPESLAIDAAGNLLVGGTAYVDNVGRRAFALRLLPDGTPDPAFAGGDGLHIDASAETTHSGRVFAEPDGKVLLLCLRESFLVSDPVVFRLTAAGLPDATWGTAGAVSSNLGAYGASLGGAIRTTDGGIAATHLSAGFAIAANFHVLRFAPSGALDTAFGGTGRATTDFGSASWDNAFDVVEADSGALVAAGSRTTDTAGNVGAFTFVRHRADGSLDPAFGTAGRRVLDVQPPPSSSTHPTEWASAIARLPDGRLVAAGHTATGARYALARLMPDGSLDTSLQGKGTATLASGASHARVNDLVLQPDRKPVIAATRDGQVVVMRLEGPGPTAVQVSSSLEPAVFGQAVTLTARVLGASPTGTVTFRRAGADIPGCVSVPLAGATAQCPGQVFAAGPHAIVVSYGGDADDPAVDSPPFTQHVLSPAGDVDGDGIPDLVEIVEGTNPVEKDNDVFAETESGARRFAMQLYRDFLGREGDVPGVNAWAAAVSSGAWTRLQVIDAFLSSDEFAGRVAPIVRLYFAMFQRVPDYDGLMHNARLVRIGTASLTDLADFFTHSPEFATAYGSLDNAQFVALLYQNVLGRAPDAQGLAGWVSMLEGGASRGAVLVGFSESPEYLAAIGNEVFLSMLYTGMLRRSPEPGGLAGWLALLDAGATRDFVIRGFLLSTEYRNRFLP